MLLYVKLPLSLLPLTLCLCCSWGAQRRSRWPAAPSISISHFHWTSTQLLSKLRPTRSSHSIPSLPLSLLHFFLHLFCLPNPINAGDFHYNNATNLQHHCKLIDFYVQRVFLFPLSEIANTLWQQQQEERQSRREKAAQQPGKVENDWIAAPQWFVVTPSGGRTAQRHATLCPGGHFPKFIWNALEICGVKLL